MGYYASLFANTAITKEAALPSPGRGVAYFSDFVGPYWLFIPIGALVFGAYFPLARSLHRDPRQRRSLLALLALPIAGTMNAGYIILIGGDYIHARLFMAPFFAVCAPVAAVAMTRRTSIALLVVPWAAVCALSLRTTDSTPWSSPSIISINGHGSFASPSALNGDPTNVAALSSSPAVYVQLASPTSVVRLEGATPPGISRPTIATSWIGPESYQLGPNVEILDLLGLADPLTSHLRLARRGAIAGHEKPLPTAWIAAALGSSGSAIAQLDSLQSERPQYFTPLTAMTSGSQLRVQIAWANAALQCPAIKDLLTSTTTPLTFGSFMSNIYHSHCRTTLRIPPNPQTAFHTYCGSGTPAQVKSLLSER
jgi:arabinofuranosyltransferase